MMIQKQSRVMMAGWLALMMVPNGFAAEFWVSPGGSDSNPGTEDQPFQTLEAGRDALRAAKGEGGGTVWLMEGRYERRATFEIDQMDSGTQTDPVVFRAVEGAEVLIDGGIGVPHEACKTVEDETTRERLIEEVRGQVLAIDLKTLGVGDPGAVGPRGFRRAYIPAPSELFIDGKPQQISRWPNEGFVPVHEVVDPGSAPREGDFAMKPAVIGYESDRPSRWVKAKDFYLSGIFNWGFADDTIPVAKVDPEAKTFTTALPHLYGFVKRSFTSWYALNLLEEIDLPGEYFIDRENQAIYFLPPEGFKDQEVRVSVMSEPLVAIEGASWVQFEGITFENSRGTGVYIERGNNNLLAGCTFRNLGVVAAQMGKGIAPFEEGRHDAHGKHADPAIKGEPISRAMGNWHEYIYAFTTWDREAGTGHGVLSCDIHDMGAGGIMLGGGDRVTLKPGGNYVRNCDISRVNRWDRTYKAPVNIDGVGNRVEHNHIHDSPGMGIYLHGNDHVVALNHMHHLLLDMSDQGMIYMGRDASEAGNLFEHNFFHHATSHHKGGYGVQAIFFDDYVTACATVRGNVFYKAGSSGVIKFFRGGEVPIENNIVVDCPQLLEKLRCLPDGPGKYFSQDPLGKSRCIEQLDVRKPPYSVRYPVLREIVELKRPTTHPTKNNYVVNGDYSEFVDAENLNFTLKEGSKVYAELPGFEEIPFGKIGLYEDEWRALEAE